MNGFNQDTAELFYRREAHQADALGRMMHASRILGTPSPPIAGVVNLDDPSQAKSYLESINESSDPVPPTIKRG